MQILSALFGFSAIALIQKKSPFTTLQKVFLCLNFYLLYQFTTIARLYSLEIFLLFTLLTLYQNRFSNPIKYMSVLSLLCLTSVFGMSFSGVFFAELLLTGFGKKIRDKKTLIASAVTTLIFLFTVFFILGASRENDAVGKVGIEWFHPERWTKIFSFIGSSIFLVPDFENTWGRAAGLDLGQWNNFYFALTLGFLTSVSFFLRKNVRALSIFLGTFALSVILIFLILLSAFNANYYGHITVSFLCASWIYLNEQNSSRAYSRLLSLVLGLQAIAGVTSYVQDIQRPFSRGQDVAAFLEEKNVTEVIPGIRAFSSSYIVHANIMYFDQSQKKLTTYSLSSLDFFKPDELRHALIPRAYQGLISQDDHGYIIAGIKTRFCNSIPNLRVITNSILPGPFLDKAGLQEENKFMGSIHPLEDFVVYQFVKSPEETFFCRN